MPFKLKFVNLEEFTEIVLNSDIFKLNITYTEYWKVF